MTQNLPQPGLMNKGRHVLVAQPSVPFWHPCPLPKQSGRSLTVGNMAGLSQNPFFLQMEQGLHRPLSMALLRASLMALANLQSHLSLELLRGCLKIPHRCKIT